MNSSNLKAYRENYALAADPYRKDVLALIDYIERLESAYLSLLSDVWLKDGVPMQVVIERIRNW